MGKDLNLKMAPILLGAIACTALVLLRPEPALAKCARDASLIPRGEPTCSALQTDRLDKAGSCGGNLACLAVLVETGAERDLLKPAGDRTERNTETLGVPAFAKIMTSLAENGCETPSRLLQLSDVLLVTRLAIDISVVAPADHAVLVCAAEVRPSLEAVLSQFRQTCPRYPKSSDYEGYVGFGSVNWEPAREARGAILAGDKPMVAAQNQLVQTYKLPPGSRVRETEVCELLRILDSSAR